MKQIKISESEEVSGLYRTTAHLVTLEDFLSQAEEESEKIQSTHKGLELGRENGQEIIQEKPEIIEENTEFGTRENNLDREILDLNQIVSQTEREKEIIESPCGLRAKRKYKKIISEGMLWHTRLGHASLEYLKQLQKSEERLEKVKFDKEISECKICIVAKMESLSFRDKRFRAIRPLHTIHTDIMGPIKPASFPGDSKFILVFIDDYSRYARAYCVNTKTKLENF